MSYTLGNIKVSTANQLGASDGTSSVPKRDRAINDARREYYGAYKWSWAFKTATVTLTARVGSLPSGYNDKFGPECVYFYSGTTKYEFAKVEWDDVEQYTGGSYVYALNKNTDQIKINDSTFTSITMDYYQIPSDAPIDTTQDSTAEIAPDITAIVFNAVARWWLTSERSTANYDRFMDMYRAQLLQDKKIDSANKPVRGIRYNRWKQGYNKAAGRKYNTGYVGQV